MHKAQLYSGSMYGLGSRVTQIIVSAFEHIALAAYQGRALVKKDLGEKSEPQSGGLYSFLGALIQMKGLKPQLEMNGATGVVKYYNGASSQ